MRMHLNPFEDITKVDLREITKESPLKNFELRKGLFQKEDDHLLSIGFNWEMQHWETLLENRLLSIERNFGYALFYYNKGIPDDQWYMSPGKQGQSIQYFPHFEENHYSNLYNFTYFVDVFFLQSFTVYETIGHLLFKLFDLEDNPRCQVSFNNAIYKLKKINTPLYKDLNKVKYSDDFQLGMRMRHDIAHNHPPHRIDSGISKLKGLIAFGVGKYTTSKEIKNVMIGFLSSIKKTFEVLEKHLQK
ncbi:Cthe_2314 family HEPN domain-containing protein [Oceanobacillus caeni]|uniref:Cthe_2314 family HEPN domain-containing protein n=1 Tax=Oceanobacillus caeni TaxID=405946 RepID=UPI002E24C5F8|nr:Cthe_2314 family HEPN domain-containing protein [Oceanobacillus caeni]